MSRKGFTLIELLVVIAIIAILAAILFPVFARAREKARQTSCLSNVKQLALATHMYVSDYDEVMYPNCIGVPGAPPIQGVVYPHNWVAYGHSLILWPDLIYPYVKNTQMFRCPSDASLWIGYGYNYYYLGSNPSGASVTFVASLADIEAPAETICIAECTNYNAPPPSIWGYTASPGNTSYDRAIAGARHNGGGNLGFCDGHAKWMKSSEYLTSNDLWDLD